MAVLISWAAVAVAISFGWANYVAYQRARPCGHYIDNDDVGWVYFTAWLWPLVLVVGAGWAVLGGFGWLVTLPGRALARRRALVPGGTP